jgi:DNA-binding CsgD family transcriptional regulator
MTTQTLTPRQEDILRLKAEGRTVAEIARFLGISEQGVKNHLTMIRYRLNARTTPHALALWETNRKVKSWSEYY